MFLRMIYDDKLAQAAYLIGCQRTGEAIVIDPLRDVDRYQALAKSNGLRIVAAAETHIHADFLSGARQLAEQGAKVYVSDEGDENWKYQWLNSKTTGGAYNHQLLKDGDRFSIGNIDFTALHTPGHTPEHICFMVTDRGGGADKPIGIATGDFIFVGDLGRPDLLESAAGFAGKADPSAHLLFRSVGKFNLWPDYLQIWPAHGAGSACGKALGAVPSSTVGYEKMFNPSIKAAASEQGFVDYILDGQPEPPLYFARMKSENKLGPKVLATLPAPAPVSATRLRDIVESKATIIDTRPWTDFKSGHLPGSLALPLVNSFNTDAGSMVGENDPIYLVIEQSRLDEAIRDLVRIGLDSIRGWIDPAVLAEYKSAGGVLETLPELTVAQSLAYMESAKPFVLDVRRHAEFVTGHIEGAANIAHTRLLANLEKVPKGRPILVNCQAGARSARACSLLKRNGYLVTNIAGGINAWRASNAPIVTELVSH